MKAVIVSHFGPIDQAAQLAEVPDPVPGHGELILDVAAVEANYPDLLTIEGRYQFKPPLPFSPGKFAVGRIGILGPGVAGLAVDDRVAVHVEYGAYAQRMRVAADACHALPAELPFQEAAALGLAYQTAWFALVDRAQLCRGETVLVLGASGGVGVASLQLAKALGAGIVTAAVREEPDAAVARAAGADGVVLVGGEAPIRDVLRDRLAAVLGHRNGADIVIDPVGGEVGEAALRTLGWCGRFVVVGFAAGAVPEIRANYLLVKNIAILGLQWSDFRDRLPERVRQVQTEIFRLNRAGLLRPVIECALPMSRFQEALVALRDGAVQGKLILEPTA